MKKIYLLSTLFLTCFSLFGQTEYEIFQLANAEVTESIKLDLTNEHSIIEINQTKWEALLNDHPEELNIQIPFQGELLNLRMSKVELIKNNFVVRTSSGKDIKYNKVSKSVFYQGVFEGYENSHFALSILNKEIIGIGSIPGIGDVNLGKLNSFEQYIFFSEAALSHGNPFACNAPEDFEDDLILEGFSPDIPEPAGLEGECVGVYFEIDEDIYLGKGGVIEAADYIIALFNEVALVYDGDEIGVYISDIFVWEVESPYDGITSTLDLLELFGDERDEWTGDLAHFVSYRGNGGIAWVNTLCHFNQYYRKAVSDVYSTFAEVPVYSWSVEVVSHEMGHNLGSPHTHACFWNGDDTPIDGCGPAAGYSEGCDGPLPEDGTVMSYCHLTGVGIDLALGFGEQPAELILDRIASATCLLPCPEDRLIDAEVSSVDVTSLTCEGDLITAELTLINNGHDDLESVDIIVKVDDVLEETISWTGALASGLSATVDISDLTLDLGEHTLRIELENPNGVDDMDIDNDTLEIAFEITAYPILEIDSYSNISCAGLVDGEIDVIVSSGTPDYTYLWNNGAGAEEDATGLSENTYTLTVTDAEGCATEISQAISEPAELVATATVVTQVACFGDLTGEANVTVVGGVEDYTYSWSTGGDEATETGLGVGSYTITVEDANGCTDERTITITEPHELVATASVIAEPICYADLTGEGNLTVAGGVAPYTYSWSSGGDEATETGLGAGTYTVTVEDANGCSTEQSITITAPTDLVAIVTATADPLCFSDLTGEANAEVTGGVGAYTYLWSTGGTEATESGLGAGTYTITVEDENGCTTEESITITEPALLTAIGTVVDEPLCFGDLTGEANVTVTGGVEDYTYSWSSGGDEETEIRIGAGTYNVRIQDANGCTVEQTITITEPEELIVITSIIAQPICFGDATGEAEVTVTGGVEDYNYSWSSGGDAVTETGLGAGMHTIIVEDYNGCVNEQTITITSPDEIEADAFIESEIFGTDGAIDVTITGGTPEYMYAWSNGEVTEDITDLESGTYTLTVTDENGCTAEFEFLIESQLGIDNVSNSGFKIYPNPATTTVYISNDEQVEILSIQLYNSLGQLVFTENAGTETSYTINVSQFAKGVYYINLNTENQVQTMKLLIE